MLRILELHFIQSVCVHTRFEFSIRGILMNFFQKIWSKGQGLENYIRKYYLKRLRRNLYLIH